MPKRDIDMREFLNRVRQYMDSIKEGDNGDFFIDRQGIRVNYSGTGFPDITERDALGLSNQERDALLDFEDDCALTFPCTEPELIDWAGCILGIEIPETEPLAPTDDPPRSTVITPETAPRMLDVRYKPKRDAEATVARDAKPVILRQKRGCGLNHTEITDELLKAREYKPLGRLAVMAAVKNACYELGRGDLVKGSKKPSA